MTAQLGEEQGVQEDDREVDPGGADSPRDDAERDSTRGADTGGERGRAVGLVILAIALIVFGAALVSWTKADDHDADAVARAELRDTVLITARSHIETMNSYDYRDGAEGLKKWEAVTTGTMKDGLVAIDDETRQLLIDQQKIATGKVVEAAVVDLAKDTATVIAMVEVTVRDGTDDSVEPTVKRNRFSADLVKVGGTWLLENLAQVAVNIS